MKKIIMIPLIGIIFIALTGCSNTQSSSVNEEGMYYSDGFEYIIKGDKIDEVRNIETGVHYYMKSSGNVGGFSPVYNSDGTVKVTN